MLSSRVPFIHWVHAHVHCVKHVRTIRLSTSFSTVNSSMSSPVSLDVRPIPCHSIGDGSRCLRDVMHVRSTHTLPMVGLLTRSRALLPWSCDIFTTTTRLLHRADVQHARSSFVTNTAGTTVRMSDDPNTSSLPASSTVCRNENTAHIAQEGKQAHGDGADDRADIPGTQIMAHSVATACHDVSAPPHPSAMRGTPIQMDHGGVGSSGIEKSDTGAHVCRRDSAPCIVATARDVVGEVYLHEIANTLEERRQQRRDKMFDSMIVFEGGCLSDHDMLGDRLIMRDFVHFALYHKKWGYHPKLFRKYRQWMTSGYFDPIPFAALRNQYDFERCVAKIHESTPGFISPTQLFQPYYGWVLAEYLVTTVRAKFDPREPLVVYDVGAGTGALALSILDYLAENFPAEYARCEYHVLEQNPYLIQTLRNKLVHHYHHVHIHHLSVLNWRALERRRCVVIAIELMSSMPHDCIVWDGQGCCNEEWIVFGTRNNLATASEKHFNVTDPVILRYLRYLNWMHEESFHHLQLLCVTDGRVTVDSQPHESIEINRKDSLVMMISKLWWVASPFNTAWLPTAQMLFLEMLAHYFPRHHLFAVDWSSVRQGLVGVNGPVVQVKMRIAKDLYLRRPLDTFCNNAGMNDLCFPTDFDHLGILYQNICGEKDTSCMSHPEFWRVHGGDKSALFTTKSGFNPLLEDFSQLHVFTSHHPAEL